MAEMATGHSGLASRRYKAPEGPNGSSVATYIHSDAAWLVLGADLERSGNPETGWEAVLAYAKPPARASLIKVPHHGSIGAHHDQFWAECVSNEAVAILTPWSRGAGYLPTQADLDRLSSIARAVYLTAIPALRRVDRSPDVRRLLKRLHGERSISTLQGWGQVRARWEPDDGSWRVEVDGDAVEVR
jgi:hypothetical protein